MIATTRATIEYFALITISKLFYLYTAPSIDGLFWF